MLKILDDGFVERRPWGLTEEPRCKNVESILSNPGALDLPDISGFDLASAAAAGFADEKTFSDEQFGAD